METKTMDENVFNFIYVAAMRDAVLQNAYEGEKKWLYEPNYFKIWRADIQKFMDEVLTGTFTGQKDYDDKFLKTAEKVCSKINSNKPENRTVAGETSGKKVKFTFGNAQKLLNIMLKYFYITCYNDNTYKRNNFRFCHCPMDQIMLNKVWEACKCKQDIQCRRCPQRDKCQYELHTISEMKCYEAKGKFTKSWGKEDFEKGGYPNRYLAFQAAVRVLAGKENPYPEEKPYPIEYDYSEWGNQADGE